MVIRNFKGPSKENEIPGKCKVSGDERKRFYCIFKLFPPVLENCNYCSHTTPPPPKPPDQAFSYRPISFLYSLSKIAEVFIARQLDTFIKENNILTLEQFGFRKDLSAPYQVYRLAEHITTGKIKKHYMASSFPRYWKSIRQSVNFRSHL